METDAIKHQTRTLKHKQKLRNGQDLQDKYKQLKAERSAASNLNKLLEKQVRKLTSKLQAQTALDLRRTKEEIENLIRKNSILQQEIIEISKKLNDHKVMEEEYKLKVTIKT